MATKKTTKKSSKTIVKNKASNSIAKNTKLTKKQSKSLVNNVDKATKGFSALTWIVVLICLVIGFGIGYFVLRDLLIQNNILGGIING